MSARTNKHMARPDQDRDEQTTKVLQKQMPLLFHNYCMTGKSHTHLLGKSPVQILQAIFSIMVLPCHTPIFTLFSLSPKDLKTQPES